MPHGLQYVSTYKRDFTPKQKYASLLRGYDRHDFHGSAPYALDGYEPPESRFLSSTHDQYRGHDPRSAGSARKANDFHGRPAPYALHGRDTPDRFVSASHAQFRERDLGDARPERVLPFDFQGRPVPFAFDEEGERLGLERYESAAQRHFSDSLGERPARVRAIVPARGGQPFADHEKLAELAHAHADRAAEDQRERGHVPGRGHRARESAAVLAGKYSTEFGDNFTSKDLLKSRPRKMYTMADGTTVWSDPSTGT